MLYHIENQFGEPLKSWHWNLVEDIASNFPSLAWTRDQKLSAHFTLKYKFETDKIEELESVLEDFARNYNSAPIRVGGFDHFEDETVFVKIDASSKALTVSKYLMKSLEKISWMQWKQYDNANLHFHMTLAEKCEGSGREVLKFLMGKEKYFNTQLNNISILKCTDRAENGMEFWKLHKNTNLNRNSLTVAKFVI